MSDKNRDLEIRSDGSVRLNSGQTLASPHEATKCYSEVCVIHSPTKHPLRGEQLFFNGKHMVRRVGDTLVIDPDDYFYLKDGKAILRNSASCTRCGDSIISTHRHDFVSCSCGAISVDGGLDYFKRSAEDWTLLVETSVIAEEL